MIDIRVDFDARALQRRVEGLRREVVDRVAVAALNRAIATVKTAAGREIRRELSLPAKTVSNRLRVRKATSATLEASIRAKDYDPGLNRFSPAWKRGQQGGAVIKLPGRGRLTVLGAFTGPTRWGGVGVYRREGAGRYPIRFLRASDVGLPTFLGVLMQSAVNASLRRIGREKVTAEFNRLIQRNVRLGSRTTAAGTFSALVVE